MSCLGVLSRHPSVRTGKHGEGVSSLWTEVQTRDFPNKKEHSTLLHNVWYFHFDGHFFDAEII
jgi:hypothetical protein